MKKFKSQKGVTLVALVITIIVLIILAGISINLVLGNNGIITIAKKTKENTELARVEEETQLNELYTQLESSGTGSGGTNYDAIAKLTEFKTAIANAIDEAGGIRPDTAAETTVFADNIKGILKEVTKNATATTEDITEGKTAWVNGELIVGSRIADTDEKTQTLKKAFYSTKAEDYLMQFVFDSKVKSIKYYQSSVTYGNDGYITRSISVDSSDKSGKTVNVSLNHRGSSATTMEVTVTAVVE